MQQNIQYNKTAIVSVILVCFTIFACFCVYVIGNVQISSNEVEMSHNKLKMSNNTVRISEANIQSVITRGTDKFTHCIQIVMSEARQAGKPIDGEKAKNVCKETIGK